MLTVKRTGYWSGLFAFFFTFSYVAVQLMQVQGWIHFPIDEILIYGTSLCIVIPFIIEIVALHYSVSQEKRFWTTLSILFTTMYAVFVTANYVVQLATVLPMKIKGRIEEVAILEQTPHSMFWDYDALGYIFMGIAMLFAVPALERKTPTRYARLALLANGLVTPLITIVYFYGEFSENLLLLGYPWAITAPLAMLLLALSFRQKKL